MATTHLLKLASLTSLCFWSFCLAQQKTSVPDAQLNAGITSGIVEAAIGNGDLKPARFAHVVAVPTQAAGDLKKAVGSISDVIDNARAKAQEGPQASMVELQCVGALMKIKPALETLRQAANGNPNNSQGVVFADADEMGEFTLRGLSKQSYTIFATGKVGMNAALWLVDLAPSEQSDRLKMARPQLGCYDPNGLYKP
jgi:hypothetical protein